MKAKELIEFLSFGNGKEPIFVQLTSDETEKYEVPLKEVAFECDNSLKKSRIILSV
jgi:hypothetical protein